MRKWFISLGLFFCFLTTLPLSAAAYAQLSSLQTQFPSATGKTLIKIENINEIQNIELASTKDKVVIKEKGVYLVIISAQVGTVDPDVRGFLDAWFVKNGKMVPDTTQRLSIDNPNQVNILMSQLVLTLVPGDTFGVGFSANTPSLGCIFQKPDNEPACASFVMTIFKLAEL